MIDLNNETLKNKKCVGTLLTRNEIRCMRKFGGNFGRDEEARTANIKNNSRKPPRKSPALKTINGGFWLLTVDRHLANSLLGIIGD